MNAVDLIVIGFTFVMAVWGYQQGLIVGALSLIGFAGGAYAGSKLGPLVLEDGEQSVYAPLGTLIGAIVLGGLFALVGELVGSGLRQRLGLRTIDGIGGALLLGILGLLIAWIGAAVTLETPFLRDVRPDIHRSDVVGFLNKNLPSSKPILNRLARFDPFPTIDGPRVKVGKPPKGIASAPDVVQAGGSILRVLGSACGLNVQGSGWIATDGLIVTNAHVIAGQQDTQVQIGGEGTLHDAEAIHFDPRNDLAVLRATGVQGTPPLPIDNAPRPGTPAAILGFPENGPSSVEPGRIGETEEVVSQDAYGRGPVTRRITVLRGSVRQGNSGGPMVDDRGRVVTTIFAATDREGSESGYGVPAEIVEEAVMSADPTKRVSTGPCGG
ncbi:MAG: MarP family serine protease [Thermoleophilaceae bacterium]|nr:MarP family serine protease [Thermoleophilaceae bacterium]